MIFESPEYFLLFFLIVGIYIIKRHINDKVAIKYPNTKGLINLYDPKSKWLEKLVRNLKYLLLMIIVIALSKPQLVDYKQNRYAKGIDILVAIDVSVSMNAEDFKPNRMSVAKETLEKFIQKRKSDRIGLVTFGGEALTAVPLTTDYNLIVDQIRSLSVGSAGNGTAIGLAISTGLNRLKSSKTKNKVMILLTDGENNMGNISPLQAAKISQDMNIKVYTIGVGSKNGAYIPVYSPRYGRAYLRDPSTGMRVRTKLDEITLQEIADVTNGQFFIADSKDTLNNIYSEIDQLEKTKIKQNQYQNIKELFPIFLWAALLIILIENLVSSTFLVAIP